MPTPKPYRVRNEDDDVSFAWTGAQLPPEALSDLAVGAVMTWNWSAPHDALPYLDDAGAIRTAEARKTLASGWNITSQDDAMRTLGRLIDAQIHTPVLNTLVGAYRAVGDDEARMLFEDFTNGLGGDHRTHMQLRELVDKGGPGTLPPLPGDVAAWDLVRAVFVAQAAHTAGFIDERTGWSAVAAAAAATRARYRDWYELGAAYLYGRAMWATDELKPNATAIKGEARAYLVNSAVVISGLLTVPTSPWLRVPLHVHSGGAQ